MNIVSYSMRKVAVMVQFQERGGDNVDNDNNVVLAVLSAVGTGPNQSQYTNYFEVFHSVYSHIIKHLFNYTNKMHKVYSLFFNAVCTVHHV